MWITFTFGLSKIWFENTVFFLGSQKLKHIYIYLYILIYTDLKLKCIRICIYTHIYTSLHTYSFSHICFPYFINLSMVDFNFNVKKLRHLKIDNYKKYYKWKIAFGFYEDKDF